MNEWSKTATQFAALILILLPCQSFAQTAPQIMSGRPGQSIGPRVLGTGIFQVQSGLLTSSLSGPGGEESFVFENVIRYGLNESFELSMVLDHRSERIKNSSQRREGLSENQVGFRYNLRGKPEGWLPAIGIQTRFRLTSVGNDYKPAAAAPITKIAIAYNLGGGFSSLINGVMAFDGSTAIPTYRYTLNFAYSVNDKVETFIELFGNERAGQDQQFFDLGLGYFIGNDLKLDLAGGWGENFGRTYSFLSFGLSTRFHDLH